MSHYFGVNRAVLTGWKGKGREIVMSGDGSRYGEWYKTGLMWTISESQS